MSEQIDFKEAVLPGLKDLINRVISEAVSNLDNSQGEDNSDGIVTHVSNTIQNAINGYAFIGDFSPQFHQFAIYKTEIYSHIITRFSDKRSPDHVKVIYREFDYSKQVAEQLSKDTGVAPEA